MSSFAKLLSPKGNFWLFDYCLEAYPILDYIHWMLGLLVYLRSQRSSGTIHSLLHGAHMLCETRSNYATTSHNYASNSLDWFDDSLIDAFTYTVLQTHFWLRCWVREVNSGLSHFLLEFDIYYLHRRAACKVTESTACPSVSKVFKARIGFAKLCRQQCRLV